MSAKATVGIKLLSSLRKTGSFSAVVETPTDYFLDEGERTAFLWLKDYVQEYKSFPTHDTFLQETGIKTVNTNEPLAYYQNKARQKALYYVLTPKVSKMHEAIKEFGSDTVVDIARDMVMSGASFTLSGSGSKTLVAALDTVMEDYHEARAIEGLRGVETGYAYLDGVTDGWQNSDLITLVGRPGAGKSYMMLNFAHAAWKSGRNVLFVSMEMNEMQIARRLLAIESKVNPTYIRTGALSSYTYTHVVGALRSMNNGIPFNIITGSLRQSVPAVRALCEELSPDIIFVDASYLLIPQKKRQGNGRRESVSDVVEELKTLAIDINRPIVQSVQFNRQADKSLKQVRTASSRAATQPRTQQRTQDEVDAELFASLHEDLRNHVSHLSLAKIGETDVIGQASSVILGLESYPYPPFVDSRRCVVLLKGREGESGMFVSNYQFNPVDFSEISKTQLLEEYRIIQENPRAATGDTSHLGFTG